MYIASKPVKENHMNLDWNRKPGCYALGAALALVATTALADPLTSQPSVPQTAVKLAIADSTEAVAGAPISTMPLSYPSSEAGVRRAAAQGPEALRRYIWRTRMIYNYYFWNFAKQE
jgi:hypothetical protein